MNTTNHEFKVCDCRNCQNSATRLIEINYIYKKGWFCDSCAVDISFRGLGREILENEQ
ncbi:MAG TPA: hypothetical protein VFP49_09715 [Nitrososphaeraceae archaeon]|nr:hypothetical protein [Nitrososphaeraceae archaeon]